MVVETEDGGGQQHISGHIATLRSLRDPQRVQREMQQQKKRLKSTQYLWNNFFLKVNLMLDAFLKWFHGTGEKSRENWN